MTDPAAARGEPPTASSRGVSRRAVLAAVGAVAVGAVVGVPLALTRLNQRQGMLVPELLSTNGFTVAHRGGSANWPEMSGYAYEQAADHGVNALELSLARTKDGVWFGLHDATLDRTSGVSGEIAAELTWTQVQQYTISAAGTSDPSQPSRPYARLEEVVDSYAKDYTIFVDPKVVDRAFYPELFALLERAPAPQQSFIAKGFATSRAWPRAARERGFTTWGYYYSRDIAAGRVALADSQAQWDVLGLDATADTSVWAGFVRTGKPVIAHIVATRQQADVSLERGATGLMVSDVLAVLG